MRRPKKLLFALAASLCTVALLAPPPATAQITFRRAIELSLAHSGLMKLATADQLRARQNYLEARDAYLPQMTLGSGLAYTYGYPLSIEGSAPSIIDFGWQQALFNPAQHEFVRSAHRDWDAANYLSQDRRNQVILETALDYEQLDLVTSMLNVLRQEQQSAAHAEQITNQRVQAGVDAQVELTRAKLASAKAAVKIAQMQESADLLRARLSQLTGLPASAISTSSESIPKLPEISQQTDFTADALAANPEVAQANADVAAKEFRAKGEHKVEYPAVDFVTQYGLFSKANNFQKFFLRFQRNNATVGVAIRFPFLNFAQSAHAKAADAETLAAQANAQGVKDQIASDTLKLQRSVNELSAAKEVAKLEYQLAQSDTQAAQARVQSGGATIKDEENARITEFASYVGFLQAGFDLDKAEMQLLETTNQIQTWALQ